MRNILILLCLISSSSCYTTHCDYIPTVAQELLPKPIEEIPLQNEANVRLPEKIKAYGVNRYIDPSNPRIMHERHVVYRIEEDPKWRLTTNANRQILIGNTLTNSKLNNHPALLEKELALELQRQRLINAQLVANSEMLIDTGSNLNTTSELLHERTQQMRNALEVQGLIIRELRDRLKLYEEKIKKKKRESGKKTHF